MLPRLPSPAAVLVLGELFIQAAQQAALTCCLLHCCALFITLLHTVQEVTLIDFPQMVSMRHHNAAEMFERDVNCIVKFFAMKMKWVPPPELIPRYTAYTAVRYTLITHDA
jgi:RIO-like serine/threonine protein kinase